MADHRTTRRARAADEATEPRRTSGRRGGGGLLETMFGTAPVRRAPPVRRRLVDLASEWLTFVVAIRQTTGGLADASPIRARAIEFKERLEQDARKAGFNTADLEAAVFALVAFTDESVIRAGGAAREMWMLEPLQVKFYGAQLAGEHFFDRLDQIRRDREARIEALEVYYCCLAFGFLGRYGLSGPDAVRALLVEVEGDVGAVRGKGMRALSPHATRREAGDGEARGGLSLRLVMILFVPALIVVWLLIKLVAVLGAGGVAAAIRGLARQG